MYEWEREVDLQCNFFMQNSWNWKGKFWLRNHIKRLYCSMSVFLFHSLCTSVSVPGTFDKTFALFNSSGATTIYTHLYNTHTHLLCRWKWLSYTVTTIDATINCFCCIYYVLAAIHLTLFNLNHLKFTYLLVKGTYLEYVRFNGFYVFSKMVCSATLSVVKQMRHVPCGDLEDPWMAWIHGRKILMFWRVWSMALNKSVIFTDRAIYKP